MGFLLCICGMIMILFIPGVILLPFTKYIYTLLNMANGPLYVIAVGIVLPLLLTLLSNKAKKDGVELGAVSKIMVGLPSLAYIGMSIYIIYNFLDYFRFLLG